MDAHVFLKALTIVLCVAAITTLLFQRLRQPVVLGYILAGLIVGPHVPIPLVADRQVVQTLSELGVILLMFALGLEFRFRKLIQLAPTAGITAIIQCSIMVWLGFLVGQIFGWTNRESLFAGAIIAISSTTIIAKAFDEQGIKGKLRELVVGILIVEDLIGILLMVVLTALSSGDGVSSRELIGSTGRLAAFLIGFVVIGLLLVPRMIRAVHRLQRPETLLVTSIGICFAGGFLAQEFGYSVALGAFIAGSLVAESGEEKSVEHLIQPVRDMFAAIFFVSVGMLLNPTLILQNWLPVVVLTLVVVVGKIISVSAGAFLTGNGTRTSVQAGMSLAQIGEFSFIIAGLGIALKATGEFLYPVAVAISAITTLFTPWLIRASGPVANFIDRKLPRPLQTFTTLYESWLERLRTAPSRATTGAMVRRLIKLLLLDILLLMAVMIGASVGRESISNFLGTFGFSGSVSRILILVGAAVLAAPFAIGIFRIIRRLGFTLAESALPKAGEAQIDLAAAPRRALLVTIQLAMVLLIGLPFLAITQPFWPQLQAPLILALLLVVLGFAFWKSATNLQEHVRAGAEVVVEALVSQLRKGASEPDAQAMSQIQPFIPGLGETMPVRLSEKSLAIGKTLADLNIRGLTGATVLAITRGEEGVIIPTAEERLKAGDVLALIGTHDAVEAAKAVLLVEVTSPTKKST